MIPTMILLGLVLGYWWRTALIAGAIVWPLLLITTGTETFGSGLFESTALAIANAAFGVAVVQIIRRTTRPRAPHHAPRA